MSHRFSNRSAIRQVIRQQAQYRTWQEVPFRLRIQILEQLVIIIEQLQKAR